MVRRLTVAAVTNDALATEEIRRVEVPSVVNMWAATDDEGDTLGLLLNKTEIMPTGRVNLEVGTGVVDTSRDQCVFDEVVGAGQLRVPATVVTTLTEFILSVRPILG